MQKSIIVSILWAWMSGGLMAEAGGLSGARDKAWDRFLLKDNKVNVDLVEKDIQDIFGFGARGGLAVQANDDKRTFTRTETLDIQADFGPQVDTGPVSLFLKNVKGRKIEVFRQFEKPEDAYNLSDYPPLTWTKLPYTARLAQALESRAMVRFQTRMAFQFGVSVAAQKGIRVASGSVASLFYGDIEIEVFKRRDGKIQLRLVALREKSVALSAKLGLKPAFTVFGLKPLDKALRREFEMGASAQWATKVGNVFVLEYLFDLAQPEAAMAFDALMNPLRWRNLKETVLLTNPLFQEDSVGDVALANFAAAEAIANKAGAGVQRKEQAEAVYANEHKVVSADVGFAGSSRSEDFVQMDIDLVNDQEKELSYRLSNFTLQNEVSFLKGFLKRTNGAQADAVLSLMPKKAGEDERQVNEFLGLIISCFRDERTRLGDEQKEIRATIHRMVPQAFHQQFGLDRNITDTIQRDARTEIELVIHREAFVQGSRLSGAQIVAVVENFIDELQRDANWRRGYFGGTWGAADSRPREEMNDVEELRYWTMNPWLRSHGEDIEQIVKLMPLIFAKESQKDKKAKARRWKLFTDLRRNELFRKIGPGILTRVVHAADKKFGVLGASSNFVSGMGISMRTTFRQSRDSLTANTIETQFGEVERISSYRSIDKLRKDLMPSEFRIQDQEPPE